MEYRQRDLNTRQMIVSYFAVNLNGSMLNASVPKRGELEEILRVKGYNFSTQIPDAILEKARKECYPGYNIFRAL